MKSIQKVKRVQLQINHKENLILLGLVSAEPDYKLSLNINRKFKISLRNLAPLKIRSETGNELTFSRFSDQPGSAGMTHDLFSNRCGKYFLLKKLKNIDYLFLIHNTEDHQNMETITSVLRELESVNAVFNIDLDNLKDRNLQYLTL